MTGSDWTSAGWRTRSLLRRTREVGARNLFLLARAFFLLLGAKLALKYIPVRKVIAWKQRPPAAHHAFPPAEAHQRNRTVRWAVLVVARYSPIDFVCFPRCLAASSLLRQQGIESRLHYGVARQNEKLVTHTWLEAAGEIVIGGEVAGDYSTLAVY